MKKFVGLGILAVLIIVIIVGVVKKNVDENTGIDVAELGEETTSSPAGIEQGDAAPDFELKTLDGKTVRLSDYKGKKVILNFWATWCPPCQAEMPHMQEYYENEAKDDNVEILAVNLTGQDRGKKKIEKFIEDYGLTFTVPFDEQNEVGTMYQAFTIPTTYMINTDGTVQNQIVGPMDPTMIRDLTKALK